MKNTIEITIEEYEKLKEDQRLLNLLMEITKSKEWTIKTIENSEQI